MRIQKTFDDNTTDYSIPPGLIEIVSILTTGTKQVVVAEFSNHAAVSLLNKGWKVPDEKPKSWVRCCPPPRGL